MRRVSISGSATLRGGRSCKSSRTCVSRRSRHRKLIASTTEGVYGSWDRPVDDLLIRGGHVIDGSGAPGREADVAVLDGRITAVEPRSARPARRVIDAGGHIVAPGLIDIHTHSDFTLPLNQRAESKIRQGVTLEVVGNCGFSVAAVPSGQNQMQREYLASSAPWLPFTETTFGQYVAGFPATAVNVILQVGHHTLRLMA